MAGSNDNNFNGQYFHKKYDRMKRSFSEIESSKEEVSLPLNLSINNSLNSSPNTTSSSVENNKRLSGDETINVSSNDEIISVSSNDEIFNKICNQPASPAKKRKIRHNIKEKDAMNLLRLPEETILKICQYHPNMARHGIKKERTPKDQERRNKNTIACRKTRRVKKLQELAEREEYNNCQEKYYNVLRETIRCEYYIYELMKLLKEHNIKLDLSNILENSIIDLES